LTYTPPAGLHAVLDAMFFRPLKRAMGDGGPQSPQSDDWGYHRPPATRAQSVIGYQVRNSVFARALIREILVSRAPLRRAILVNLSQKITKPQANIPGVFGSFLANI
jgi:hypothetical protein